MNWSHASHFRLSGYFDVGRLKYLYFAVVLLLYLLIVGANLLLILVICVNRSLHEPMYMFLLSLFANELYGSTGLFPLILVQILARVHTVPASFCFLQAFWLYSYGGVEYFNLAVMSYDRYLAICCPLHYSTRMSRRRIGLLVALAWLYPLLVVAVVVCVSLSLQLCGNTIPKVYCHNSSIVSLSCSDTMAINVAELSAVFVTICTPSVLIVYTYGRIFRVCFRGSRETRQKAVSTCSPQLASLVNFTFGASFETLQFRLDVNGVPGALRIFLSLYWLSCQPLLNPAMYGLNLAKIRLGCRKLLLLLPLSGKPPSVL